MKVKYSNFLKHSIKDYRFWFKFILGLSQILSITIFITYTYITTVKSSYVKQPLIPAFYSIFINLSFFTTLSNLFCGIFFLHSAFYHHLEGKSKLNNDEGARLAIVYITLTLLLYNLDQIVNENPYQFSLFIEYLSFICEHSLVPLLAIFLPIFLYNHKSVTNFKDFTQKYLWWMLIGLVGYGIFFWIVGELSLLGGGLGLYYWNGAKVFGQGSHFVYPFLDFNHELYFFKNISSALESALC